MMMRSLQMFGVCLLGCCLLTFLGCGGDNAGSDGNTDGNTHSKDSIPIAGGDTDVGGNTPKVPAAAAPTGNKITLKLNMQKGDSKKGDISVDRKTTVGPINMDVRTEMGMSFEILEVDDEGNQTFVMTFERMKINVAGGLVRNSYDSEHPASANSSLERQWREIIGQTLWMKMTPRGEVIDAGFDDVSSQIKQQMEQTKDQMNLMAFPDKPVDNGDTWTGTMQQGGQMPMTINVTYTLLDQKDGEAIIKVDGKITGQMSGTMTGTMTVDIATGWTSSANLNMKASGSSSAGAMSLDADIKLTTK